MTAFRNNAAQHPSDDNSGVDPTLSGIGANFSDAPGQTSGASDITDAEEVIAQAEEILNQAQNGTPVVEDVEILEPEEVEAEDEDAEDEGAEAEETISADRYAAVEAQAAEWQGRYLRLHAEWDTYRRRTQEERKEEKARATEKLVKELLPVIDDLERTVAYGKENGEAGLLSGVEAVQTKFMDILTKSGVEIISPEGQAFDAIECPAVATGPVVMWDDDTVALGFL